MMMTKIALQIICPDDDDDDISLSCFLSRGVGNDTCHACSKIGARENQLLAGCGTLSL